MVAVTLVKDDIDSFTTVEDDERETMPTNGSMHQQGCLVRSISTRVHGERNKSLKEIGKALKLDIGGNGKQPTPPPDHPPRQVDQIIDGLHSRIRALNSSGTL